jgi:hypothetical protein
VFEPVQPRPKKANLAVVMHGYYEYAGYNSMFELIRHTVRKGNVVIFPRWQTGHAEPCPGPLDIEPCVRSALAGIRGGLRHLRADRKRRVQPRTARTSYFGFSFGGVITANLTNRHRSLKLPRPRAIFLEDPHDGGLTGSDEPAVDDSLAGIPRDVKLQCHSSKDGVIGRRPDSSCNAIFPKLGHIPNRNKDLVMLSADTHGDPDLTAEHGVCASPRGKANAYDWRFCWKTWDALRSCAYSRDWCRYALGDTRQHRSNGRWSDGVAVAPLKIQDDAPIGP